MSLSWMQLLPVPACCAVTASEGSPWARLRATQNKTLTDQSLTSTDHGVYMTNRGGFLPSPRLTHL